MWFEACRLSASSVKDRHLVYPASSPPLFKCEDAWMFVESVQLTELTCEHKLNFLKIKQQNEVKLSRALVIS